MPPQLSAHLKMVAPYLVEFTGTLFLTLVVSLTGKSTVTGQAPIAIGLMLAAMIYMGGHVSGANYNPAVSMAVLVRGKLGVPQFAGYVVVQVLGALCAARMGALAIGAENTPLPQPGADVMTGHAFLMEFLFTYALAAVVLNVATTVSTEGNSFYGLAIGVTVTAGAYAAGPVSGAAFNPAVATGLFAVHETTKYFWLYWVGPLSGGLAAGLFFHLINSEENDLRFGAADDLEKRAAAVGGHTSVYRTEVTDWLKNVRGGVSYQKSFASLDRDGDKKISLEELTSALLEQGLNTTQISDMFAAADTDNDGTITEAEYIAILEKAKSA